ncbi:hypothetical protein GCM10009754_68830 [Amycolatopsis minnesotensis]|uniref:Uncharacterized protein n=1 Tax=Amycolatopsis minnesotensis TaxID=337894 RepID=A0ABN2S904_9PSEU
MEASIEVGRVGQALVVGRPGADREAIALAEAARPERGRTTVVVGASAVDAVARIDPWVIADIAETTTGSLRLVAPKLAVAAEDKAWPPARLLSELLGTEVVVPERMPIALPDGSLFVPGSGAGWVAYRSGGPPFRVGPRLPVPPWQRHLPVALPPGVAQIPFGLWVRAGGGLPRPGDPLFRQPPDPDRMFVVIGAPGESSPGPEAVASLLRSLTEEGRDRAVLAHYGCPGLADEVVAMLGRPVRVAHGVPFERRPVVVDESGNRVWRPFAVESVYLPDRGPVLDRWVAPAPEMVLTGPGSYRLVDGWKVEVVPRGLLVKPESLPAEPEWETGTGPKAELVLASDREVPATVVAAVDELVRGLSDDAVASLRIVPLTWPAALAARRLEATDRVVWPGALEAAREDQAAAALEAEDVAPPAGVVVTADGRVLPAEPVLTASSWDFRSPPGEQAIGAPAGREAPEESAPAGEPARPQRPEPAPAPATAPPRHRHVPVEVPSRIESTLSATVSASSANPVEEEPAFLPQTELTPLSPHLPAEPVPGRPGLPPLSQVSPSGPVPPPPGPAHGDDTTSVPLSAVEPAPPTKVQTVLNTVRHARVSQAGARSVATTLGTVVRRAEALPPLVASAESRTSEAPVAASPKTPEPEAKAPEAPPVSSPAVRTEPAPRAAVASSPVEVPADARSTPEQRKNVRDALGSKYDVATRAVTKLLSERPGLRASRGEEGALLAELAAVRVFGEEPGTTYDTDFHVCLAGGLRRLPTVRTVVVRGVPDDVALAPETLVRLREPLVAAPSDSPHAVGGTEALIWATTARRLHGLVHVAGPDQLDVSRDVVLPGHTRLRVLGVEGGPVRRILLAEEGSEGEEVLARLRAAAKGRAAAELDGGPAANGRWYGPLPAA